MKKVYKEMANGYILEMLEQKMENMVGCRGTISSLTSSIQKFALRDNIILEPFEESIQGMDCGFNTNLGEIGDTYFDFEVFMLPTNKEDVFIIIEVSSF